MSMNTTGRVPARSALFTRTSIADDYEACLRTALSIVRYETFLEIASRMLSQLIVLLTHPHNRGRLRDLPSLCGAASFDTRTAISPNNGCRHRRSLIDLIYCEAEVGRKRGPAKGRGPGSNAMSMSMSGKRPKLAEPPENPLAFVPLIVA
jgi:hypothetical protein